MFAANSPYSPLVTSVAKVSNSVPAKFFLARIMVVILRRVIRPMLALRGDRPVSPTIPPRYILGLQTAQTLVLSSLVDHDCCSEEAMKARAGEEGEPNSFIEYLIYDDQGYVVEDSSLSE